MSNPVPSSLALISVAPGAAILSADHRTNYSDIQSRVNALITTLSGGVSGQVLQAAGASSVQWGTLGGLYRKTTAKTVVNSVAETDLLNGEITVGAGVLGTSGVLRLSAWGDWKQNSGAPADIPRFKLKLGATTLLDTNPSGVAPAQTSATRYPWHLRAEVMNLGAANSQWASLEGDVLFQNAGALAANAFATGEGVVQVIPYSAGNSFLAVYRGGNSGAVDTSAGQALALSVILPTANANTEIVLKGALVEVV